MGLVPSPSPVNIPSPRVVAASRLVAIDYLRGVATLLVCFCHFQRSFPEALRPYIVEIGKTGVQIFFVISGFIIPYGLYRAGYRLTQIHRFYVKRILRLHPPYLMALAVFFMISAVAVIIRHDQLDWAFPEVLKASVYLWIPPENPVFWTLIVELKYYFFISLAFPLFFGPRWLGTACIVLSAAVVFYAHDAVGILIFVPYFLLGFAAARCALGIARTCEMALLMVVVLAAGVTSSSSLELTVGLATALLILYTPAFESRVLTFLGARSYSLYLIHFPVGVKVINLLDAHTPAAFKFLLGILALGCSMAVAELIYRFAEKPAMRWSQSFKLFQKPVRSAPDPSVS